jgi:hypothetical protein
MWAPLVALHFLPHSTKNIRSDRCSNFPDSLNTNTVDGLLHIPPEIKIQGCQVRRAPSSVNHSASERHLGYVARATACPPSVPTTIPSSTNVKMENLVSLSFILHLFHVSVVFQCKNMIIWNPTMTFGTHCIINCYLGGFKELHVADYTGSSWHGAELVSSRQPAPRSNRFTRKLISLLQEQCQLQRLFLAFTGYPFPLWPPVPL